MRPTGSMPRSASRSPGRAAAEVFVGAKDCGRRPPGSPPLARLRSRSQQAGGATESRGAMAGGTLARGRRFPPTGGKERSRVQCFLGIRSIRRAFPHAGMPDRSRPRQGQAARAPCFAALTRPTPARPPAPRLRLVGVSRLESRATPSEKHLWQSTLTLHWSRGAPPTRRRRQACGGAFAACATLACAATCAKTAVALSFCTTWTLGLRERRGLHARARPRPFPMRGVHLDTPRKHSREAGAGAASAARGQGAPGSALRANVAAKRSALMPCGRCGTRMRGLAGDGRQLPKKIHSTRHAFHFAGQPSRLTGCMGASSNWTAARVVQPNADARTGSPVLQS